ncbi:TetR/AcrR family transcriptional regulator [Planomonospora venezuelensis]|uniref:AcrR family transcriptional regulator n=1 Tax=Planomonospora venezuelensis TaxID=1999 RepID=A0A841DA57_PLAVE|nr:TetR/AcrR family transcriptional regulator [Planomonospora venezuelensis]MBB5966880.1 AcrR family transcriptional regulator [Planomonospora venezuelensis]GIN02381.1 TetR family transcriptional regulator [Planomonospora venezuelensis]
MTTEYSGGGDLSFSLKIMWRGGERPSRGPKPGLDLTRIVEAAIRVADAEGLAALSMRRIATELGVGTMSLYRYVPGKAELLDLMLDAVYGEDIDLEQDPGQEAARLRAGGWRAGLEEIARGSWALHLRHPWILQVSQARPVLGPSSITGLEIAMRLLDGIGLDDFQMMKVISLIDSYVTGTARLAVEAGQAAQRTGVSDEDFWQAQGPFIMRFMSDERFPTLTRAAEAGVFTVDDGDGFGFEFGLQRVLDGIEAFVAAAGREHPAPGTG